MSSTVHQQGLLQKVVAPLLRLENALSSWFAAPQVSETFAARIAPSKKDVTSSWSNAQTLQTARGHIPLLTETCILYCFVIEESNTRDTGVRISQARAVLDAHLLEGSDDYRKASRIQKV